MDERQFSIRLPAALAAQVRGLAVASRWSISQVIREALEGCGLRGVEREIEAQARRILATVDGVPSEGDE